MIIHVQEEDSLVLTPMKVFIIDRKKMMQFDFNL